MSLKRVLRLPGSCVHAWFSAWLIALTQALSEPSTQVIMMFSKPTSLPPIVTDTRVVALESAES